MSIVANFLKNTRKDLGLSVKHVIDSLSDKGIQISPKTLYGWETGHRQPDADTFLALCQIYGVTSFPDVIHQPVSVPLALSEKEKAVVLAYRSHPDMQNAVDTLLNVQPQNDIADDIVDTLANGEDVFSPQNIRSE